MKNKSNIEEAFAFHLRVIGQGIPAPVREHRFHPTRRWRFDFAWPTAKLAVECDGGQWKKHGGRHARDGDREKLNEAAGFGWRVLRFSGQMLKKDPVACIDTVRRALAYDARSVFEG